MYIGHFVVAEALLKADPSVPALPVLVGVAYPDLLWPFLIYAGKEKLDVDPQTPLQKTIKFISYPYSHSLVRSGLLTLIPAVGLALIFQRPVVGLFFFIAAMSHWLLDAIVHLPDLPVFGFGPGRKIGLGLWNHPGVAFVFEYLFYMLGALFFVSSRRVLPVLIAGGVLHLLNANSFFGFTKTNPTKTPKKYASLALFGYIIAIVIMNFILTS
jgi:hypothetical protein